MRKMKASALRRWPVTIGLLALVHTTRLTGGCDCKWPLLGAGVSGELIAMYKNVKSFSKKIKEAHRQKPMQIDQAAASRIRGNRRMRRRCRARERCRDHALIGLCKTAGLASGHLSHCLSHWKRLTLWKELFHSKHARRQEEGYAIKRLLALLCLLSFLTLPAYAARRGQPMPLRCRCFQRKR